jgi:hypothetical protein
VVSGVVSVANVHSEVRKSIAWVLYPWVVQEGRRDTALRRDAK